MKNLLLKPWVHLLFMNFVLLQVADQLNHWTTPLHIYLQVFWILPIYAALYSPPAQGALITFFSALMAGSYWGLSPHFLLFALLLFHIILFLSKKHLQTLHRLPPIFLPPLVTLAGFLVLLPVTPLASLLQMEFWLHYSVDLLYNLALIPPLAYAFFHTQDYLLRWAQEKEDSSHL